MSIMIFVSIYWETRCGIFTHRYDWYLVKRSLNLFTISILISFYEIVNWTILLLFAASRHFIDVNRKIQKILSELHLSNFMHPDNREY